MAKKHVTQHLEATATAAEVAAAQTAQASLLSPIADQERGALDKLREEDLPASRESSATSVPGSEASYNSDSTLSVSSIEQLGGDWTRKTTGVLTESQAPQFVWVWMDGNDWKSYKERTQRAQRT